MFGKRKVIAAVSAAALLIGTVAFAASAPFSDRPSAGDLPVISADLPLSSVAVEPPAGPAVTPPVVDVDDDDVAGDDTSGESREVVKPMVRDEDADSDDDGESDANADDEKDTDSDGEESSKTDTDAQPAEE